MQGFHIDQLDREQYIARAATVLISEGIEVSEENWPILEEYVSVCYPDLRKCLNILQQNCVDGQLMRPQGNQSGTQDYMVQAVGLFKSSKIHEARQLIVKHAAPEEYEGIYRLFYQNLDWWSTQADRQHQAIVIIANRLRDHSLVADPEIALAACMVELANL
jgi:hypothetical protein